MLQLKGHTSYFGNTGYNLYSQSFFKALKEIYPKLFVRSYTNASSNIIDDLVDEITFFNGKFNQGLHPKWSSNNISIGDVNIILNETNHSYFYEKYNGIKIAYNIWETTRQPETFFNKLLDFDQVWIPSEWQKEMMINQGYPANKVFVVPGGVDDEFKPLHTNKQDNIIRFLAIGAWSFRKSTKEIIETFLDTFKDINNVELILAVDNLFTKDGMSSTEKRLKFYNFNDSKIKVKHFVDRESYIQMVQKCDIFISCSRGEGWNAPLIEALACGKPSIFSNCGGQLEFSNDYPLKVNIIKEIPAICEKEKVNFLGNYYEPDYNHLNKLLLDVYKNLSYYSDLYIKMSDELREKFSWKNSAKKALNLLMSYLFEDLDKQNEFYTSPNTKEILNITNNLIYKEIFEFNIYDNIPEMKMKTGDVVLDVGAHIGIFSRYAAIQGASKVISFEMEPKYFSCLRKNVRPEDDIFNCVLLDKTFFKFKLENDILVNGFDLNYFYVGCLFNKIDFMKIDIMGKELTLLHSIQSKVYNIIKKISIKCYNLLDKDKLLLIEFMKSNSFMNYYNIILPNQPIQLLYFWR